MTNQKRKDSTMTEGDGVMLEKISYWYWRIKILLCYFKHDYKNVYTRVNMGGHYSGRDDCERCYKSRYISGEFKP
jgi:hypothetical protein